MPESYKSNKRNERNDDDGNTNKGRFDDIKEAYGAFREANDVNNSAKTKKDQQRESSKKAAKVGAKAAANYFAPGVGGKVVDAASKTKLGNAVLNKGADTLNRIPGMAKALKKADDKGITDKADQAVGMLGGDPKSVAPKAGNLTKNGKNGISPKNGTNDNSNKSNNSSQNNKKNSNDNGLLPKKDKNNKFDVKGFFNSPTKLLFLAGAGLILLLILSIISIVSGSSGTTGAYLNEGLCVQDNSDDIKECKNADDDAKNFYARVKEVKSEYSQNGKSFDPLYIVGFYIAVSLPSNADIDYDTLTKSKIQEIVDAMFKDNSNTFDEDTFKKNLKEKILPSYLPDASESKYNNIIEEIFDYVENFKEIYNTGASGNPSCISSDLTADQLCSLHNSGNLDEWINQFGSVAQQDYSRTGVFASITTAQAILESGWACSDIHNNLFGIKCSGYNTCVNANTHEYIHGQYVAVVDSFRTYNNVAESISDHSKFLLDNSRYSQHGVFSAKNYQEQAHALKAAGYATSKTYAESLINIVEAYDLNKWDTTVTTSSSASCDGTGTSLSGWDLRTVAPTASDKAFNYKNSNRGQCVWYAQARAIEIAQNLVSKNKLNKEQEEKIRQTILGIYGDGGVWVEQSTGKFKTSNNIKDLKAGSIISWKQAGAYGHVAVIEDVTDKNVTITEGWATNTGSCPNNWGCINFKSRTISLKEFYNSFGKYYNGKGYSFNGYIYFLELA